MNDLKNPKTYDDMKFWIQKTDRNETILVILCPGHVTAYPVEGVEECILN